MYIHIYIHIQRSQALHTMGNVMGNIVLKKLTPAELYNKLQELRDKVLVLDPWVSRFLQPNHAFQVLFQ